MRRFLLAGLLLALVANVAAPAFGGDTALQRILKLDKRETKHYKDLDRRLRLTASAVLNARVTNIVVTKPMTVSGHFFSGEALCPAGSTMTGGGADWGTNPYLSPDWKIVSSRPTSSSTGWAATVYYENGTVVTVPPVVYAVCARA